MSSFKRMRPLLGTFVEISLRGSDQADMAAAATRAFQSIAHIERLMNFHQASSELSMLNKTGSQNWLTVHTHTLNVLKMANVLFRKSEGTFDVRCGTVSASERHRSPVQIHGRRVRKNGSFKLDLGGIAKGYAVDLAVSILKRAGIPSGLVNAGGDLRAFGDEEWPIAVRHPARPRSSLAMFPLKSGAIATSAAYFSRRRRNGKWSSAIVSSIDQKSFLKRSSITVISSTCMVADGLTKVVALAPTLAARALRDFRSHAFVIDASGIVHGIN